MCEYTKLAADLVYKDIELTSYASANLEDVVGRLSVRCDLVAKRCRVWYLVNVGDKASVLAT